MYLTKKTCDSAKPQAKPYKLTDGQGLYLQVTPEGARYWRLKYRYLGKEKCLALGVYPEVSLAEAREKRELARKLLATGADPAFEKREQKRQAKEGAANTFEVLARKWHAYHSDRWSPAYVKDVISHLERDVFPALGNRPVASITAPQLLAAMRKIEERGAQEVARRTLQLCGQIFRYAIVNGYAERSPASDLRGALKPVRRSHYAALEAKDLPEFLQTLERNDARLFMQTRLAIRLLMLTFVRTSELINARWEEFDLEGAEWVIPAERMKMRRTHIIPLSRQALDILKELRGVNGNREYVFASLAKPRRPMSNNTILFALGRLGYKGRATGHGFRALAMSTIKEKLGYRHEVVDRQLAHAPRNKVDAAYDRAQFLDERRKMMQKWADYLDRVGQSGTVIRGAFDKVA
jgi:integrase